MYCLGHFITNSITALKTAFLGLSLPIQGLIIAVGLLYLAYKANLGGIADKITAFYNKAKLIFQGVSALFKNFKDGSATITGDLAKQIKDAGLQDIVTTFFKIFRRLHAFVTGVFKGISATLLVFHEVFSVVFFAISYPINKLIELLGFLGISFISLGNFFETDTANSIGVLVGGIAGLIGVIKAIIITKKAWVFISKTLIASFKKIGVTLKLNTFFTKAWALKATVANKVSIAWAVSMSKLRNALKITMLFIKSGAIKAWALAVGFATKAINLLTLGIRGLGVAFRFAAANPLIIVLTAIIAVIGLVIYNFDTVKKSVISFCSTAWDSLSRFVNNLITYWKNLALFLTAPFRMTLGIVKTIFLGIWDFIYNLFTGKSLFESGVALINTLKEGILSAWTGLKESFTDVLGSIREMLPFSDAKTGPLSTLTLSGNRLISTIGEGVSQAAPAFVKNVNGVFSQINPEIGNLSYASDFSNPLITPSVDTASFDNGLKSYIQYEPEVGNIANNGKEKISETASTNKTQNITINISNITLPNVEKAEDFMKQLESELVAYGV